MPCGDHRKVEVTDRAHRYRAQQCAPAGPMVCEICGSDRNVVPDHKDGDESNDDPGNLRWLCKACNTREGLKMAKKGIGRRTRQYNAGGAKTLGEYVEAAVSHRRGAHDAGGAIIHATPKGRRRHYAEQIWQKRKMYGNQEIEHATRVPAGWHVRTVQHPSGHQVKLAFSPDETESQLISISHPEREKNPAACRFAHQVRTNPDIITPLITGIAGGATFAVGQAIAQRHLVPKLNGRKRNRRNPDTGDADQAFYDFHGKPPTKVLQLEEEMLAAGNYFALGKMGSLWTYPLKPKSDPNTWGEPNIAFDPSENVRLAADPRGRHLVFIGGNQDLDSSAADQLPPGDEILLGIAHAISYTTQKRFDGFRTSDYAHQFGEDTGEKPELWYNRPARRLFLVGGAYSIAPVDLELGASPGIVN